MHVVDWELLDSEKWSGYWRASIKNEEWKAVNGFILELYIKIARQSDCFDMTNGQFNIDRRQCAKLTLSML